jgi:hypothetical protein
MMRSSYNSGGGQRLTRGSWIGTHGAVQLSFFVIRRKIEGIKHTVDTIHESVQHSPTRPRTHSHKSTCAWCHARDERVGEWDSERCVL